MSQHQIHYEVLNSRNTKENERHWAIEVHATQRELQAFDESGYLVREKLFQGHDLKRLRNALDQLEERERETRDNAVSNKRGWGFIPRHLMDKEPVFLELLKFQPVLSIARNLSRSGPGSATDLANFSPHILSHVNGVNVFTARIAGVDRSV